MTEKETKTLNGFLLWKAANTWQREIREVLEPLDLTHVQFLLLQTISNHTSMKQSELAIIAGTDVMMTSKVLRALVKKKLITRKSNRGDARAFTVAISPEGQKLLVKAEKLVISFEEEFFNRLVGKRKKFIQNLSALTEKRK
jgi:MarR family transcriptional regulator, organic hydroperoxide resistance regulator